MDECEITVNGVRLKVRVDMRTKDGKPGLVSVDEGIPFPFCLLGCRQVVGLVWEGEHCHDLFTGREVLVHETQR